jgi:hypothetical protein
VQADFSIECGADDECLELPWTSEDGALRYVDLKQNPARIADLDEARHFPDIADFLRITNSAGSAFLTAKCDAWFTQELTVEDEPFGTSGKFGSYVDVLFASPVARRSWEQNEACVGSLVRLLQRAPEMPASAELLVRRCLFAGDRTDADDRTEDDGTENDRTDVEGFYMTCYVFGYSDNEEEARKHWGIALRLLGSALIQISTEREKQV